MEVFLVCVILKPTKKQADDDGMVPTIIVEPKAVMAKDEQQAAFKAARLVPPEYEGKEERLEFKVLPFRSCAR